MADDLRTPKYLRLKEFLKSGIQNGDLKPGEKIFSENELSATFKISRHTIRQAIGELVAEGWLSRVRGSGTFVNRSLGERRTRIIGVVTTYLDDYIFPGIIRGIDNTLSGQGYNIILSHTGNKIEREAACLLSMSEKNVDGFIIEPTKSALPNPNLGYYEELDRRGIPYIFINGFYPGHESSFVVEDDELGGYTAANHLFKLGHARLGGIFKIDDIQGHRRYGGVVKAHRERGLSVQEEAISWYTTEDMEALLSGDTLEAGLKRLTGCTGIICYNDQVALKLINALRSVGRKVPEDISVVSFDDSELASATDVKLTTLAHPKQALGEKAASCLLSILKYERSTVREVMRPELVVRGSTGPCRL